MDLLKRVRSLDAVTKVGFIILFMMVLYIIFLFILKPVFIVGEDVAAHTTVMGDHVMTFTSPAQRNLNIAALFISFIMSLGVWLVLRKEEKRAREEDPERKELDILRKALSPDEKRILNEIEKAGEITQDSLRFRLDWSKAKVSAILLQLDRMNIIQRERQGKTYNVFISKKK